MPPPDAIASTSSAIINAACCRPTPSAYTAYCLLQSVLSMFAIHLLPTTTIDVRIDEAAAFATVVAAAT
ncbi:hypothetical protein ACLOJK_007508, partial [Asimina triloba]